MAYQTTTLHVQKDGRCEKKETHSRDFIPVQFFRAALSFVAPMSVNLLNLTLKEKKRNA